MYELCVKREFPPWVQKGADYDDDQEEDEDPYSGVLSRGRLPISPGRTPRGIATLVGMRVLFRVSTSWVPGCVLLYRFPFLHKKVGNTRSLNSFHELSVSCVGARATDLLPFRRPFGYFVF